MPEEIVMKVEIKNESGYEEALEGLALNKKQDKDMRAVALRLARKEGGHNKFLESIFVWLKVTAPRYWWQEADTYRLGTKQSESTMHTLMEELKAAVRDGDLNPYDMFEKNSITWSQWHEMVEALDIRNPEKRLLAIKRRLPEGFIQTRMWCMSYKTLRNIMRQRWSHRLPHWRIFLRSIIEQLKNPEFVEDTIANKEGLDAEYN